MDDKTFVRANLGDGTFKTLVVSRDTTTIQAITGMIRKLCLGHVTEEKLMKARNEYQSFWFYRLVNGSEHSTLMSPTELVWANDGPPDFTLEFKRPSQAERQEIIRLSAESNIDINTLETSDSVSQTFVPVVLSNRKTVNLLITASTTTAEAVDELYRQLCHGQVTDERLSRTKRKHPDHWLYVSMSESEARLEPDSLLWPYYTSKDPFRLLFKAPNSALSVASLSSLASLSHRFAALLGYLLLVVLVVLQEEGLLVLVLFFKVVLRRCYWYRHLQEAFGQFALLHPRRFVVGRR